MHAVLVNDDMKCSKSIYTVSSTNIGTLGKYEQRQLWKKICIVYPFYLSFKKFTKFQPIIEVKQLKVGRKSHDEINAFSISCWPQLLAPNYCNVLFPAQQLWVFSYNAWRVWRTPDKRSETIFFDRFDRIHDAMHLNKMFRTSGRKTGPQH